MSMALTELVDGFAVAPVTEDVRVQALSLDSRHIDKGAVFLAVIGEHADGRAYIGDAVRNGAVAVLAETNGPEVPHDQPDTSVPLVWVEALRHKVSALAARFYAEPSKQMQLIGVTGTNGKSSVAFFLAQALKRLGIDAAMIGTIGVGRPDSLRPSRLTTPDAIQVQAELRALLDQGVEVVCMEVSSHGLAQGRVETVAFKTAVFTNLSQDHLDFHPDMAHYAAAKRRLFEMPTIEHAVLNLDDETARSWQASVKAPVYGYGTDERANLSIQALQVHANGIRFQLVDKCSAEATRAESRQEAEVTVQVLGVFNAWNLAAVAACLRILDIPLTRIAEVLPGLRAPDGRMQRVVAESGAYAVNVVVDYAHTPDALEKALETLRQHCASTARLRVVFGCGGDRDTAKRPLMGRIAEQLADEVILTNDNPRSEAPGEITAQIAAGMQRTPPIIHDRQAAIRAAITASAPNDWVLLAGKGHERTQVVGGDVLPFDDYDVAQACLEAMA